MARRKNPDDGAMVVEAEGSPLMRCAHKLVCLSMGVLVACQGPSDSAADSQETRTNPITITTTAHYQAPPPAPDPTPVLPVQLSESEIRRRLEQAGAASGDVQVSLAWSNRNDLDLHMATPCGATVSYQNRSSCGMVLDVDQNAGGVATDTPIENIRSSGSPSSGNYTIFVDFFALRGLFRTGDPAEYVVRVIHGGRTEYFEGRIQSDEKDERKRKIMQFDVR